MPRRCTALVIAAALFAGVPFPEAGAAGDANGDGYDDLAIGVWGASVGSDPSDAVLGAGAVVVLPGATNGPDPAAGTEWDSDDPGVAGTAETFDGLGYSLVWGDFNGDDEDDLAATAWQEEVGVIRAGAVTVLPGSASGTTGTGSQQWHPSSAGLPGSADEDDLFGWSLASGDFDRDGFDDLAIGVPGEDVRGIDFAGAVVVLYGSAVGLTSSGSQAWHQDSPGLAGVAERGDVFGLSLAAGDLDHDGTDDLVVGVPQEGVGTAQYAGAIEVLRGSRSGLTATGSRVISQNSPGVAGVSESNDFFGSPIAVGRLGADGYSDVAVSAIGERIGSATGALTTFNGSSVGLTGSSPTYWYRGNLPGDPSVVTRGFGVAIAAADRNGDGYDELVVGAPGADVNGISDAGAAYLIAGSSGGLKAPGSLLLTQATRGLPGEPSTDAQWGNAVAAGTWDALEGDDIAIGAPSSNFEDGGVTVLLGNRAVLLQPGINGVPGSPEQSRGFGASLA